MLNFAQFIYGFCFFFQAEDGIRDGRVTGVQTCALPISRGRKQEAGGRLLPFDSDLCLLRSEERREGKSVDLGGRRIIKKKKKKKNERREGKVNNHDTEVHVRTKNDNL